ncbi:MAG: hypothetical protein FWE23_01150 [Chitinivibrionia bacterium]|nr:hypothetical protein [Chitinivibrionia bacterium]
MNSVFGKLFLDLGKILFAGAVANEVFRGSSSGFVFCLVAAVITLIVGIYYSKEEK